MAAKSGAKSGGKSATKKTSSGAKSGVKKGMGFQAAASNIAAKEGVSPGAARAILASGTRKATPAAKRANPALKNVLPKKKKGS
jgi:hypothetical protein